MTDPCGFIYDTGASIVAQASLGIDALGGDPIEALVSMGAPVAEFCPALSAYLISVGADAPSVQQMARTSGCGFTGFHPTLLMQWEVQLWDVCYPSNVVSGDTIIPPTFDELIAANVVLYQRGLAMFMAVLDGQADGFPGMPSIVEKVVVGNLRPLGPQGSAAGWAAPLSAWTS